MPSLQRLLFETVVLTVLPVALAACQCGPAGTVSEMTPTRPCDGGVCPSFPSTCASHPSTTLRGTVYTPAGDLPLPGVTVYVPTTALAPIPSGVSCDVCGALVSGSPLTTATTDATGRFVLEGVPAGREVPLVIQSGKWRRQVKVPQVTECADNEITDGALTRLPRNRSEGDLPHIALTTGGADALECLLRKVGIDDAEITDGAGSGRVHLYAGTDGANMLKSGTSLSSAAAFWETTESLSRYDAVMMACEGSRKLDDKGLNARAAMKAYADKGGKVFASHWHNVWIEQGPAPWPSLADFVWESDLNDIVADVDTSHERGSLMAQWLEQVGASTTPGKISVHTAQHSVVKVNAPAARWIFKDNTGNPAAPTAVQYFSYLTPAEAPKEAKCGKVVFSDIHVSSGDLSSPATPFPGGCTTSALSPQEKALVFMLFDITGCVNVDLN